MTEEAISLLGVSHIIKMQDIEDVSIPKLLVDMIVNNVVVEGLLLKIKYELERPEQTNKR